MLKLPKLLEQNPEQSKQLRGVLSKSRTLLWEGGRIQVHTCAWTSELEKSISFSRRCGAMVGGLEKIRSTLAKEQQGLDLLQERQSDQDHMSPRVSRLLLIANDGSERFNRGCESLLANYNERTLGLVLDTDSSILGKFFGKEAKVKVALITRKEAVVRILTSLIHKEG